MTNNFDLVFDEYKNKYTKILGKLYPSKNSTGFTERNLSVNFSKSYESICPDAVTWFEFQFGEKNDLHLDALIVNREKNEIFLVEAKRFSSPEKKIHEVAKDIERINAIGRKYAHEFEERIPDFESCELYGVILADIWTETKAKKKIYDSFAEQNFIKTYSEKYKNEFMNISDTEYIYNTQDFYGMKAHAETYQKYHLLSMIWSVKKV